MILLSFNNAIIVVIFCRDLNLCVYRLSNTNGEDRQIKIILEARPVEKKNEKTHEKVEQ